MSLKILILGGVVVIGVVVIGLLVWGIQALMKRE
jgi:hypothetical protein